MFAAIKLWMTAIALLGGAPNNMPTPDTATKAEKTAQAPPIQSHLALDVRAKIQTPSAAQITGGATSTKMMSTMGDIAQIDDARAVHSSQDCTTRSGSPYHKAPNGFTICL